VRVLFLHPNFPAQFRQLCVSLASSGHEVFFMCQTHYGRVLPGVNRICLKGKLDDISLQNSTNNHLFKLINRGQQYRQALLFLAQEGNRPDLIISHSGWGCGLHVKEIWSSTPLISYLEWWHNPNSSLLHYDLSNSYLGLGPHLTKEFWLRNLPLALELSVADSLVAPTYWQRSQLPEIFKQRCNVIYDGIDLNVFMPSIIQRSPTPLLTYGTRGMEAIRCFPEFIEELPSILDRWPLLTVEIAGTDKIYYGGYHPEGLTWKEWASIKLAKYLEAGRVSWVGYLNKSSYVKWLQKSWIHVYLTQPFVASWSLLEAMACGPQIIASDVEPVREFCDNNTAWLVDTRKTGFLQSPIEHILGRSGLSSSKARLIAPQAFSAHQSSQAWLTLICTLTHTKVEPGATVL